MMQSVFAQWAQRFDLPVLDWIQENLSCAFLDKIMPAITFLGNAGWFWIAVAIVLIAVPKYRRTGLAVALALLAGLLICNLALKPLCARMRPYEFQALYNGVQINLLIAKPSDYSFPSGHTIASVEAAMVLLLRNKRLGYPASVLAALIAFSRLYLYVHYPTDVLCSIVLGALIGAGAAFAVHDRSNKTG